MQIQVNTDNNVEGHQRLADHIRARVSATLDQFSDRLTRVEVHLSDENSSKSGGKDKRCLLEARPAGHQPVAVSHQAETLEEAFEGAAEKLEKRLESTLGRTEGHKGAATIRGQSAAD
jgi:ribosome-associated translation inhibitor RaiA